LIFQLICGFHQPVPLPTQNVAVLNSFLYRAQSTMKTKKQSPGKMLYYHHFVGHCGAFFGLKWKIWRAKMYFSPLKETNEK